MANRGYDVVVDVDAEGDLGHTDLQEDLEFHSSNFETQPSTRGKLPSGNNSRSFLPTMATPRAHSKHYLWSISSTPNSSMSTPLKSLAAAVLPSSLCQTSSTFWMETLIFTAPFGSLPP